MYVLPYSLISLKTVERLGRFMLETTRYKLEELDDVFRMSTNKMARRGMGQMRWAVERSLGLTSGRCPPFLEPREKLRHSGDPPAGFGRQSFEVRDAEEGARAENTSSS